MILPTIVAVVSFLYAKNNPVTEGSVSKLDLTLPDGESLSFNKTDKNSEDVFECFFGMHEGAKALSSLPSESSNYKVYKVTYHSYNKTSVYTYYLNKDPDNCFYRDSSNVLYHISEKNAEAFLKTNYATQLFPEAFQPVLNVGTSSNVLPSAVSWQYLGINGEFLEGNTSVADWKIACSVSGGLQLEFDKQPDYIYAVLTDKQGNVVFDDVYENIDPNLFVNNTVYEVKLTAKWYQADGKENYGEAEYSFTANVMSPAVFYMSEHEVIRYGDFVIVSAKNIVDPEKIGFSAQPSMDFEPTFFEYGGYYHAIIPFSLDLEKQNNKELEYIFTFSYGDVSQNIAIKLEDRAHGKDNQDIPLETILDKRNDKTMTAFKDVVSPYLSAKEENIYWMTDNMIIDPTTRKIRSGFGIDIILSEANITYEHEGVNYYVKEGDSVSACLPGKVVYVGDTMLSGTTIIIEHGGGLKSLYAHLSTVSVTVGQEVSKGMSIGIVGDSGFCTGTTLHFGLYVFDTPVRYYNYEKEGVSINSSVAQVIGLK